MRILLAVSGGIDSMYLANKAPELFPGASFAVAHCNFGLRGDESDSDEKLVREWCGERGLACFVKRFDTKEYAARNGVSIEMAARELRYAWFAELCTAHGFDALATAHNANDNAETLMLNLLRGTGTKGARGMARESVLPLPAAACPPKPLALFDGGSAPITPPGSLRSQTASEQGSEGQGGLEGSGSACPGKTVSTPGRVRGRGPLTESVGGMERSGSFGGQAATGHNIKLLRPLLGTSRAEIFRWMTAHGLQWHEDRTNAENEYKRNRIRNCVFPLFKEINPSFIQTIGADMQRFAQVDDIAEDYYQEALGKGILDAAEGTIQVLRLLELKHWRYVLWRMLEGCGFSQQTFEKLVELLQRYKDGPMGTVTLSGKRFQSPTHILVAEGKKLRIASSPDPGCDR
ncbi:MAG: tRNA lysidine(34) synthetase TilS [Bacteroidales bacterium]|nr:tRNA lysidine(34) synthetase TilS [Candidatus Cryptobacteroides choladohippi]